MKTLTYGFLLALVLTSSGCYHAMVTTGLTPGAVVVDQPFASGWIYGLVPPSTVEAAATCPDGVAMVETELSFVNQLVGFLTFGIYSPMHIKVTCAAPGSTALIGDDDQFVILKGATESDIIRGFQDAADEAVQSGGSVYVQIGPPKP